MKWVGPFQVLELLNQCLNESFPKPPDSDSVYFVSRQAWHGRPDKGCVPLYVGSNTGQSPRFRTRVGDLIADIFGFFGEKHHSSGGESLYYYCQEEKLHPMQLYIAWQEGCACHRCTECELYTDLYPLLNKKRPPRCSIHQYGTNRTEDVSK